MTDEERGEAAALLARAEADRVPIAPLSETYPGLNEVDAYSIASLNVQRRLATGARLKGHKIGLTALVMQQMLGVDQPDYGHLLDDMFVDEESDLSLGEFCAPRVEIEVAFVLKDDLSGPGVNAADVIAATDFVLPAIEVIDSRIADWKITFEDTVADNASGARVVLGGRPVRLDHLDLRTAGAFLSVNGEVVQSGTTAAVLGNPITAVAWLANRLGAVGESMGRGAVVMPGACTAAVAIDEPSHVTAHFEGLGGVGISFVK